MRKDKMLALALRKRGYSYNLIHKKLNVPISTLSDWFSNIRWSQVIKRDLTKRAFEKVYPQLRAMSKARSIMWEKWREDARQEAIRKFSKFVKDKLFVAGIMLYWGEGDQTPKGAVRLANTDPRMIALFSEFLKKYCLLAGREMKVAIVIYPDLSSDGCKIYWSRVSGVPTERFAKVQVIQGRHPTKKLSHGICYIGVNSRQIKEKILKWIELFALQYTKIKRV